MKSLRLLFTLALFAGLFLISCTKETPIVEEQKPTDDTELIQALYSSDALAGKGEIKGDHKYGVTVRIDELPKDLRDQLKGKESFTFDNKVTITPDQVSKIWGDQIVGTPAENGFNMEAKDYKFNKTYMTPDGESLTEQVQNDPSILANARDVLEYIYIEVDVDIEIDENGNIDIDVEVYIEWCSIVY